MGNACKRNTIKSSQHCCHYWVFNRRKVLRRHFQNCIIIKQLMMITMVMLSFSSLLSLMSESMSHTCSVLNLSCCLGVNISAGHVVYGTGIIRCLPGFTSQHHSGGERKTNHLKYHSYPVRLYLHWGGLSQFSHIHRVRKHQNFRLKRHFWSYPGSYVLSPEVWHNQRGSHHLEPFPSFHPCRHVHL